MINNWIINLKSLAGWKKYTAIFASGFLLTLALPPFYIFPALLCFAIFLVMLDTAKSKKEAFFIGWCFGFGYFVSGLYWIANALLIDPLKFAWLIPFAVCAFPALLATSVGGAVLLTYLIPEKSWRRVIIFSSFWLLAEVIRSYYYVSGFPWNLIGYAWDFSENIMQVASITGIWGLSLLATIFGSIFYVVIDGREKKKCEKIIPIASVLVILAGVFIFGQVRLENAINWGRKLQVNIIQPNIAQKMKWDQAQRKNNFMQHLELTSYTNKTLPDNLIIWPESAVPFLMEREPELIRTITDVMPKGSFLATGGVRVHEDKPEHYHFWNSFFLIDDDANILGTYDKSHLVPFGEYVPWRKLLPFVDKVAPGAEDFTAGEGAKTITLANGIKIGPLVCYEIIFPHQVVEAENPPHIIVNVTNDSWYGVSTGPYQHFETARMRAVEEGIPVVRAANSGISGAIDRYGRVIARLELNKKGNLQSEMVLMNNPENMERTTFGRFNFVPIILVVSILLIFSRFSKKN